jgi:tight adherence protein B
MAMAALTKKKKEPYQPKRGIFGNATDYAVYEMKFFEKALYFLIGAAAGAGAGYLFYENIFLCAVLLVICGFAFIPIRRKQIIEKRKRKLLLQFRDTLESLATSIGAGSNVPDAFLSAEDDMSKQHNEGSDIHREIKTINEGIYNNVPVETLLMDLGERSGLEDVISFANVFETCYRKGGDTKEVIKNTHQIISEKIDIMMEIQTVVTSKKSEQNAMMFMPILFVFLLKMLGKEVVDLTSATGMVSTTIAVGIFVIAYFIGKRVLNIKI